MVYRLVTSQPSLSIFTWITISILLSGFSSETNSLSISSSFLVELSIWSTLPAYLPSNISFCILLNVSVACWILLQTIKIKGFTRGWLLFLAYISKCSFVCSWTLTASSILSISNSSSVILPRLKFLRLAMVGIFTYFPSANAWARLYS